MVTIKAPATSAQPQLRGNMMHTHRMTEPALLRWAAHIRAGLPIRGTTQVGLPQVGIKANSQDLGRALRLYISVKPHAAHHTSPAEV